jgi:lipopolysaccharide transport system ATP-binding protein
MKPAIRIEGVSKRFRLGDLQGRGYRTLRESIMAGVRAPWERWRGRNGSRAAGPDAGEFWALRDVGFEIPEGEVVGLIGRNGSGKSTLLKILSRIYEPTEGRATIRGRVGSLLEVGTGFHPELTGRENIYLNGSIMGMSRREIQRQFDAIVAFSEIERFLDTPVKRYSSGMYVRLAFAVAAHLEPEVLFVDEVLAVGDAAFQKKCLGKMGEVSRGGRTLIFVSHNMAAVRHLCRRVLVLDRGTLAFAGDCEGGIRHYLKSSCSETGGRADLTSHPNRKPGGQVIFREIRVLDSEGQQADQVHCGDDIAIEMTVEPPKGFTDLRFGICVEDQYGNRLFSVSTTLSDSVLPPMFGPRRLTCSVNRLPLAPGRYSLSLNGGPLYQADVDQIEQAIQFDVIESDFYGNGKVPSAAWGPFLVRSKWTDSEV